MSARALTGITLIVGPIMMIAFFLAGPMGVALSDPSDLQALSSYSVSYTHLTLPPSDLV